MNSNVYLQTFIPILNSYINKKKYILINQVIISTKIFFQDEAGYKTITQSKL